MQYQGTIANIQPAGGYQSQNGYIYTFNMSIDTQQYGVVNGEVGSKSEYYPMQPGEQITVDSTVDNHGTKFKKINPGYNNQSPPPQQGYQQAQQQAPPTQQRPQQDTRQDSIQFAQALNLAVSEYVSDKIKINEIEETTNIFYRILKTRQFPMLMGHGQEQQAPPQKQAPAQPYDSNAGFDPTDNIPF